MFFKSIDAWLNEEDKELKEPSIIDEKLITSNYWSLFSLQ